MSTLTRSLVQTTAAFLTFAAVAVDETTPTPVAEILLNGVVKRATIEATNEGPTNTLAAFVVEAKAHPDGAWFEYVTSAELNTGTPIDGRLILVVTNPTTLAADGVSQIVLDVTGLYAIRVVATADTAPVDVSLLVSTVSEA